MWVFVGLLLASKSLKQPRWLRTTSHNTAASATSISLVPQLMAVMGLEMTLEQAIEVLQAVNCRLLNDTK